ncbi:MAG: SRPBCC family protein [Chloroflexota bacterium]
MPPTEPDVIERQIRIRAGRDLVFSYFTDPVKMTAWQGITAELDPKPGGTYRINVTGRDIVRGEFTAVEPPERIAMTWGWETQGHPIKPGSTQVEITFTEEGETTRVKIRQTGVAAPERLNTAYGWQHYLTRLGLVASGRDPGPDPWADPKAAAQA